MKLTIIGSWSAYPKVNEASSGYLLEHNGFHLLIDCGSGVLSKMQRYIEPAKLDACIISHYHTDHIADIGVLQHALLVNYYLTGQKETKPLPIYGHELDQEAFSKLTYKHITTGIRYDPNQPLSVGPFTITFIQTKHPVPCFAMRIETAGKAIVYTADSAYQSAFVNFLKMRIFFCRSAVLC